MLLVFGYHEVLIRQPAYLSVYFKLHKFGHIQKALPFILSNILLSYIIFYIFNFVYPLIIVGLCVYNFTSFF